VVCIGAGSLVRELTGVGCGRKIDEAVAELSGRSWRETRHSVSAFIRASIGSLRPIRPLPVAISQYNDFATLQESGVAAWLQQSSFGVSSGAHSLN